MINFNWFGIFKRLYQRYSEIQGHVFGCQRKGSLWQLLHSLTHIRFQSGGGCYQLAHQTMDYAVSRVANQIDYHQGDTYVSTHSNRRLAWQSLSSVVNCGSCGAVNVWILCSNGKIVMGRYIETLKYLWLAWTLLHMEIAAQNTQNINVCKWQIDR